MPPAMLSNFVAHCVFIHQVMPDLLFTHSVMPDILLLYFTLYFCRNLARPRQTCHNLVGNTERTEFDLYVKGHWPMFHLLMDYVKYTSTWTL